MLDLLNQKILFNSNNNDYGFWKFNDVPIPVFFAIPTIAFHVSINRIDVKKNFIQETILYLKRNGLPKNEIAEALCLDNRLVDVIIENNNKSKNKHESNEVVFETEEKADDFYIFYDLTTKQFIDGYMSTNKFNDSCFPMTKNEYNEQNRCYYHRENIGESSYTKIHMLNPSDNLFNRSIIPTQENIINCYNTEKLFDDKSYRNACYLNEFYQVWLVLGYSVTRYNSNEYSIIDPFKEKLTYSTYFNNIIKAIAVDEYSKGDIKEYQDNTKNNLIKNQNEKMHIKTDREKTAYENLKKKYSKYGYFNNEQNESKFETQLIKMQATYDFIKKNLGKKDCTSNIRGFYDFANNVLEQLFTITYEPYILELPEQLTKDKFFEALGKEKSFAGDRAVFQPFFDDIKSNYDLDKILKSCSTDNVKKCIKMKNILNDNSYKLPLKDLFTINVINVFYNKNSKFNNLFKTDVPYLIDTITLIEYERQNVRHTFKKADEMIDDVINVIYKIIDVILDVNENDNETRIELSKEDSNDYTNFIGEYSDLDNMTESLQDSCNQLLRDIFNSSELYFSDCVVAFENTSKLILDYVMRKINSIGELNNVLKSIPDDNIEAKVLLMDQLEKINIYVDFERISVDIKNAKNCLLKNYEFKRASTLIFFAPLLLAVSNYMDFITLFEQLGADYFNDAFDSINRRGHAKQATNWNQIKLINDKFVNYCKILTLFDREEL